jgi:hypothetical protein
VEAGNDHSFDRARSWLGVREPRRRTVGPDNECAANWPIPEPADGVTALDVGRRGVDVGPRQRVRNHRGGCDTTRVLAGTRINQMAATVCACLR